MLFQRRRRRNLCPVSNGCFLRCSGNVYDYDGYIREKDFNRAFHRPDIICGQTDDLLSWSVHQIWGRNSATEQERGQNTIPLLQSRIPRRFPNRIQRLYHNRRMALPPTATMRGRRTQPHASTCFECDDVGRALSRGDGPSKIVWQRKEVHARFWPSSSKYLCRSITCSRNGPRIRAMPRAATRFLFRPGADHEVWGLCLRGDRRLFTGRQLLPVRGFSTGQAKESRCVLVVAYVGFYSR